MKSINLVKFRSVVLLALMSLMVIPTWACSISSTDVEDEDKVYSAADVMPRFIEGESALRQYIKENMQYPEYAKAEGIECNVIVQFVVMKDGSVGEVKVIGDYTEEFTTEAIRLVKSLSNKFRPGCKGGRKVNVWYTYVVSFTLH